MAGSKIRGITIELSADATGLMDSLKTINNEIRSTGTQLKDVDRLLKLDPTNTTLLTQKTQLLQEQITNTKTKLEELKKAQADMDANGVDKNSEQYQALQREIIATEAELEKLEKTAGSGSAALAKISAVTGEIGEKMENAGKKMSVVSAAIGTGFVAAAKTAIDFESAFAGVKKTVDGTDEELEEIRQGIIDLSEKTASSATDIAAVAEAAGQLGIATEDVLDFTETMVMLGDTTNLSAEDAASALAKFANITGTSAENYGRLGSVIVALGNNFATTESDIVDMATGLASAGTLAGLTEPEIFALATAMSSVGIEAAAGGTAMTQTLTAIEKAVAGSGDELEKIADIAGMTAAEFSDAWANDPITAITSFIAGLGDLDEKGESATLVLDELGMSGVRQSNMLKSLALASETLSGAVGTASSAWQENTALSEEAAKKYETTEAKIAQLKATLVEIGIQIGDILLPVIQGVVTWVKNLLSGFTELDEGTKKTIVTIVGIVAAIGPLLLVGGKVLKGISSITSALSAIGTASSGPIGLVIAAVAACAAGIAILVTAFEDAHRNAIPYVDVLEELEEAHDNFQKSMDNAKSSYESNVQASEASASAAEYLVGRLNDLVAAYDGTAGQAAVIQGVVDQINELVPGMALAWDSVTGSLSMATDEIYANIEAMRQQAQVAALQDLYTESLKANDEAQMRQQEAQSVLNQLCSDYGITLDDLGYILEDGTNHTQRLLAASDSLNGTIIQNRPNAEALERAFQSLQDAESDVATASETVQWAESTLGDVLSQTATTATMSAYDIETAYKQVFGTSLPTELQNAVNAAKAAGVDIPDSITTGLLNGSLTIEQAVAQIVALTDASEEAAANGTATGDAYVQATATTVIDERTTVGAAAQTATGELETSAEAYSYGSDAGSSYDSGLASQEGNVSATAGQIASDIVNEFASAPDEMNQAGADSGSNLNSGFEGWKSTVSGTVDDMYNFFYNTLGTTLKSMMWTWGDNAGAAFKRGFASEETAIQTAIQSIRTAFQTGFTSLPSMMASVGNQAGQGLYNGLASWQGTLSSMAWSIANSINSAARRALAIRSPSRVMEEVGKFTGEGLEIGLEKSGKSILQTATGIIGSLTDTFDTTGLEVGLNALNGGINASMQAAAARTDSSSSALSTVMSLLMQYMPYLAADKDIRFDDGTWAGVLAPSINNELERMRARSARG